ncbi:MAG: hypothetical protein COU40_02920 [Candidatus Moranbacteria bacterium CG10_big_fil_rev_8_21_14_0_10_35_21]|nr:MAG: hypothetical protein COU40_02920 [Candidatus Moranbacteria bacterium CG10_big_fil_rev_8_21_14_0_10_35_21]PJA88699.1 MAG: hypothetical protein CO139_01680 [Candidatus Moranbacteria bacterium CG_4_9_14_3_um_filter_36_9]
MTDKLFGNQPIHKNLLKHETKRRVFVKFLLVIFIFVGYFIFVSQKYGVQEGFFVAMLSWSFFVLCTPIADAGFLLDFPLRLVLKGKMIVSEIFVWILAIVLNGYAFFFAPEIYAKTKILVFFKHILEKPFPFWIIILLSLIGTFVSIKFGDELLDKINHHERVLYHKHKHKYRFLVMIFLIVATIILYDLLLNSLGIDF